MFRNFTFTELVGIRPTELVLLMYVLLSIGFSLFYANKAGEIFVDEARAFNKKKVRLTSWQFHMFWVNFVSSLVGWATVFYLAIVRFGVTRLFQIRFTSIDLLLILLAVMGITGSLGRILSRLASSN